MTLLLHWRGEASSRESSPLAEKALVCGRDTVTIDKMCSHAREPASKSKRLAPMKERDYSMFTREQGEEGLETSASGFNALNVTASCPSSSIEQQMLLTGP